MKYFLILFTFILIPSQSDNSIRIMHADVLKGLKKDNESIKVFVGNVTAKYQGYILKSDSVYELKRQLIFYSKVILTRNDSVKISAEKLDFNHKNKKGIFSGNVLINGTSRPMDTLKYDFIRNQIEK